MEYGGRKVVGRTIQQRQAHHAHELCSLKGSESHQYQNRTTLERMKVANYWDITALLRNIQFNNFRHLRRTIFDTLGISTIATLTTIIVSIVICIAL